MSFFFSGGLAEEVDEKVLHAAFIPFGDITDIQIPLDYETGNKHTSKYNPVIIITNRNSFTTLTYHMTKISPLMFDSFCPQRHTGALHSSSLSWQR